jgi:hypothetical protein
MSCEEAMSSFSLDLAKFGQKAVDNADKIVRKIGFDMLSRIVKRMPVDTGRARANTQISINNLPSDATLETDKSGNGAIRSAGVVLKNFKLGDTIFIYNNVEYILNLEYGSSKQAPQGMFRISFNEIAQHLGASLV